MLIPDFLKVTSLFLVYPDGFKNIYSKLTNFYEQLIGLIPDDIQLNLVVNSEESGIRIKQLFPNKKFEYLVIPDFEELWLRDLMGFNLGDKIAKPIFKPDYFTNHYTKKYLTRIDEQIREIINHFIKKEIIDIPLVWDGGNLVSNGKIGLLTDKIYDLNNDKTKDEVKWIIKEYLGIEPIVFPAFANDSLGHADGYIAFLDENTICLSKYPEKLFLKDEIKSLKELENILKELGLEIIHIHDRPVVEVCKVGNEKIEGARGFYNNFIKLNDTVILPEFTLPTLKETNYYNKVNNNELGRRFEVKTINCYRLGKLGGVLHCISFTN